MAIETETFLVCEYISVDRNGKPILLGVYPKATIDISKGMLVIPSLGILWIIQGLTAPIPTVMLEIRGPLAQKIPPKKLEWHSVVVKDAVGVLVIGAQGLQLTGVDTPIELILSIGENEPLVQNINVHFLPETGAVGE